MKDSIANTGQGSVEITEEMISAGKEALMNFDSEYFSSCVEYTKENLVTEVFQAMLQNSIGSIQPEESPRHVSRGCKRPATRG